MNILFIDRLLRAVLPVILFVIIAYFSIVSESFLSAENLSGLLQTIAITSLLFLGLTWLYTIGMMDVSFVAIAAFANMAAAGLVSSGYDWSTATAIALSGSMVFGLINGLLIGYLGTGSLITTIAMSGIAVGIAFYIGEGAPIGAPAKGYLHSILEFDILGISAIFYFVMFIVGIAWIIQEKMVIGHYIFAISSNTKASEQAGIPVSFIIMLLFLFMAFCSGLAGIIIAAELGSGQPSIARSLFLDGLTAVLLGASVFRIGVPNVLGTIFGVILISVLVRGGALEGWSNAIFQVIKGTLLLLAISMVISLQRKN